MTKYCILFESEDENHAVTCNMKSIANVIDNLYLPVKVPESNWYFISRFLFTISSRH